MLFAAIVFTAPANIGFEFYFGKKNGYLYSNFLRPLGGTTELLKSTKESTAENVTNFCIILKDRS
jgi:hypothetical protein